MSPEQIYKQNYSYIRNEAWPTHYLTSGESVKTLLRYVLLSAAYLIVTINSFSHGPLITSRYRFIATESSIAHLRAGSWGERTS